jgi:HSP20 family protein
MPTQVIEQTEPKLKPHEVSEQLHSPKKSVPRTDIYESPEQLFLLVDMPGVKQEGLDITLEQNILSVYGKVERPDLPGYTIGYSEHEISDFSRVFTLSNEIDRAGIQASLKNGVLKLILPKSKAALPRKIAIQVD